MSITTAQANALKAKIARLRNRTWNNAVRHADSTRGTVQYDLIKSVDKLQDELVADIEALIDAGLDPADDAAPERANGPLVEWGIETARKTVLDFGYLFELKYQDEPTLEMWLSRAPLDAGERIVKRTRQAVEANWGNWEVA